MARPTKYVKDFLNGNIHAEPTWGNRSSMSLKEPQSVLWPRHLGMTAFNDGKEGTSGFFH